LSKIETVYDTVAREYAETFSDEHERKPKDQEILHRFSQEIAGRSPAERRSGISAAVPVRRRRT
jgi:hypothetical protein